MKCPCLYYQFLYSSKTYIQWIKDYYSNPPLTNGRGIVVGCQSRHTVSYNQPGKGNEDKNKQFIVLIKRRFSYKHSPMLNPICQPFHLTLLKFWGQILSSGCQKCQFEWFCKNIGKNTFADTVPQFFRNNTYESTSHDSKVTLSMS